MVLFGRHHDMFDVVGDLAYRYLLSVPTGMNKCFLKLHTYVLKVFTFFKKIHKT